MSSYDTSAIVEEHGRVLVAGVPFAAGAEVEVTISLKTRPIAEETNPEDEALIASRERMRELFRTVKGFRMGNRIPREELHERGSLR